MSAQITPCPCSNWGQYNIDGIDHLRRDGVVKEVETDVFGEIEAAREARDGQ
jgi:hypothetical protein